MATYTIAPQPWLVLLDGQFIIPAGQLAIYAAGTSTPATVYTSAQGIAHPFPITLDGEGLVPGGLYLQPGLSYKFVLHAPQIEAPLDGAIVKTQDGVAAVPSSDVTPTPITSTGIQAAINVANVRILEYTGIGDLVIAGLAGGVPGQELLIKNLSTGHLGLVNMSALAAPAHTVQLFTSGAQLLMGVRSMARFVYLSTGVWAQTAYAQGNVYQQPFDAANYTGQGGMTWTVPSAASIAYESFFLEGRHLYYSFSITGSSVGGTPDINLARLLPQGWVWGGAAFTAAIQYTEDGGATYESGFASSFAPDRIAFQKKNIQPWAVTAGLTGVFGQVSILLD